MKFVYVSKNEVEVRPEDGEDILAVMEYAIRRTQDDIHVWNLSIVLLTESWSPIRMKLQEMGFVPAGFVTEDNRTHVKLKMSIRRSGDQSACDRDLAVPAPVLPPTATEAAAIDEIFRRPEFQKFRDRF